MTAGFYGGSNSYYNSWQLDRAEAFLFSSHNGEDDGGGGGSSDYSSFWSNILAFANGDDGAGYVVDRDGKIISRPSDSNLLPVFLQTFSKDGQTSYEYLGTLGGVILADKIISNLLHSDIIDAGHMSPNDFKSAVEDHSDWDYKRNLTYIYGVAATFDKTFSGYGIETKFLFHGYSMTAEDFGNFHYGVVGLANGNFNETILFMAAGAVQIRDHSSRSEWQNTTYWGDDPNDHYWIQQGFNYYNSNY